MSLDYWHLSMATVQLGLRNHGFEYKPTGTAELRFRVGKDWYYINCTKLPCFFISRYEDARAYLGTEFTLVDLFSALNAVNDKLHLVKASREDENLVAFTLCLREDRYLDLVAFTLCLREDRYLVFKENLIDYIRELDDAVESFGMAAILLREEEKEEMMKDYINRMMNAEDDMYKETKRLQS